MVKWTEVDAYSGMPVKEDAPTNFAGAGSKVAMPPDAMMKKKKKKTFLDARTRAYKEHQKRLENARARREERKKQAAKINEGQLDEREKGIDKLPRQFLNPDKEVMILKKGKVIVIDKKDQDRYMKQGWQLAEITRENYEVGTKERRDHTIETTPGQSKEDFEKQVEVMHKKKNSMREALAKMWGIDEGKNPFDNMKEKKYNKEKKEGKTMTGKPETKVEVEPEVNEKKK